MIHRCNLLAALLVTAALGALAVAPSALGRGKGGGNGGGGGGATPAGTIYYAQRGALYSMDAAGANKTALPASVSGRPSHELHGGARWFLDVRDVAGTYPDGRHRREVFAIRGDGASTVQLTDQPDLEPCPDRGFLARDGVRWTGGDEAATFVARRWSGSTVSAGGIFEVTLTFDTAGEIDGIVADPLTPVVSIPLATLNGIVQPDVRSFDWAPDDVRLAYATKAAPHLVVADVSAGTSTTLGTSGAASWPSWSPDGTLIAYSDASGAAILTIAPDGTGETVLLRRSRRKGKQLDTFLPEWSPDGAHVVYQRATKPVEPGLRDDVYRATSDGDGDTNLTSDIDTTTDPAHPIAWRETQ